MNYHVVMVRVGTRYGPDYVHILSDMLARNLSEMDVTPWCVTDDPESLPDDVQPIVADPRYPGWWQKVRLFSPEMPWAVGDRVLYVDLDSVITGRLEDLIQTKGIIKDWNWDCFNSSVMVWDHGEHQAAFTSLNPDEIPANMGDQEWITQTCPDFPILPTEWCVSYRKSATEAPPEGSKVVCFHGEPKPADIPYGWVPGFWKVGGFHQLPRLDGVNVTQEQIVANINSAVARDLPWFAPCGEHRETAVIVCGGPSLRDAIPDIRVRKRQGQRIISVNNTLGYLLSHGITPDAHVMLDAREDNLSFLERTPETIRYLVASQCHPAVLDRLHGRNVVLWHNMAPGLEDTFAPLVDAMVRQLPGNKPVALVPGGGTVGLRAISLAWMSGYRKIHLYGMDGSFAGDAHHAYPQPLNDEDRAIDVQLGHDGKTYRCARWMVRQAHEFKDAYEHLAKAGISLIVHGDGLIPDMAKVLREQVKQARAA